MNIQEVKNKHKYIHSKIHNPVNEHTEVTINFAISILNELVKPSLDSCDKYKFGTGKDNIKISIQEIWTKIHELNKYVK